MPTLDDAEREDFLNTRGVLLRVAVVRADGSPLVTPIWYLHENGCIYFTPRARSEWFQCLRRDPRVALCIDEETLPYRKVVVEGEAELIHDVGEDDAWRDRYRRIAERYLPPEGAARLHPQHHRRAPRSLYRVSLSNARRFGAGACPSPTKLPNPSGTSATIRIRTSSSDP